jgi:hypothetical protein
VDLAIELDDEGCIWVYASDGTVLEEAWLAGADEHATVMRQSGLSLLEEKYMPDRWTSTTLDPQEITGQLWVEAPQATRPGG